MNGFLFRCFVVINQWGSLLGGVVKLRLKSVCQGGFEEAQYNKRGMICAKVNLSALLFSEPAQFDTQSQAFDLDLGNFGFDPKY